MSTVAIRQDDAKIVVAGVVSIAVLGLEVQLAKAGGARGQAELAVDSNRSRNCRRLPSALFLRDWPDSSPIGGN